MAQAFSSIFAVLLGVSFLTLGYGLLGTLLAVRMSVEGFATLTSGMVMGCYFLGLVVGALTAYRPVQVVGHIRTFAAFASTFSAATLAHVFVVEPISWGVLRFIEGYCMAGVFMCVESWLNDRATNETRGAVLSMYMVTTYLFGGLAQFLLVAADVSGFTLFALTSMLLSLALVPIALTRAPAPPLPERSMFGLRRLLEISPLGVAGCVFSGMASGAFYGVMPRYGSTIGLDNFGIAVLIGFGIFGGLLFQFPIGRLSDRMDRRKVIMGVAILLALTSAAIALFTRGEIPAAPVHMAAPAPAGVQLSLPLVAMIVVFGGMLFSLYPLSLSHANDFIESQDFVAAAGGLIMFFSLGATIGPMAAAALMEAVGPWGLFLFMGLTALLLTAFALWRLYVGEKVSAEQKTPFQATPRTAYVLSELDPRAEEDQLSFDFIFSEDETEAANDTAAPAAPTTEAA